MITATHPTTQKTKNTKSNLIDVYTEALARFSPEQIYDRYPHNFKSDATGKLRGIPPFRESKSETSFTVFPDGGFFDAGDGFGGYAPDYIHSLKIGRWERARGRDFVAAVRELCALAKPDPQADRAGIPFPELSLSQSEIEKAQKSENRRGILACLIKLGQDTLWSEFGTAARDYLINERGLTEQQIKDFHLGYYRKRSDVVDYLKHKGYTATEIKEAGVALKKWEGYIIIPWLDEGGRPLTLYGRYHQKTAPEGLPKTLALPGIGTKRSPLYLDRAIAAGHKEVIFVEGVFDALLLQALGETRAISGVAASFSNEQIETLKRNRIEKVYHLGDPDGGGIGGTNSNLTRLLKACISVYVPPMLPDSLDPDEFVIRHGIEALKELIERSHHGLRWKAAQIVNKCGLDTDAAKERVLREALEVANSVPSQYKLELETFFWGEIRATMGDMDIDEFRELLERQINNDAQTLSDSSADIPDSFSPNSEYTQQVYNVLYRDKRWICVEGKLYYWETNHYEHSKDVVEKKRIRDFLNTLPKKNKDGEITYPFAKPNCVNNALEWLKMGFGIDPELVNPPGLNCTNGVLKIHWIESTPTWELVPHNPEQYYLYEPVLTYDPDAPQTDCDRLLSALDPAQLTIFLRSVAASLDIQTVRKYKGRLVRALLMKGLGSNGKDSIREVVRLMYGGIGMTGCTLSDFRQYDEGRKFPLSKLGRSRVNWASENASFAKIDSLQSLKAAITGDPLSVENKGKDENEYDPTAVLFFNCNDIPRLTGSMEAIASRYAVLTFNKTFTIDADPSKGEIEADPRFKYDPDFLKTHVLSAFLNRVLSELVNLMSDGIDYRACDRAWNEIKAENSHLFQFTQDVGLSYLEGKEMPVGDIWKLLEGWYQDNGYLSYIESSTGKLKADWTDSPIRGDRLVKGANQVTARILELFPKAKRVVLANNSRVIRGIGIVPSGNGDEGGHNQSHNQLPNPEVLPNNHSKQHNQGDTGNNSSSKEIELNTSPPESQQSLDDENTDYEGSTGSVREIQIQTPRIQNEHNQLNEDGCEEGETGYDSSSMESNSSLTEPHLLKPGTRIIHNESWVGTIQSIHPDGKVAQVYLDLMESVHPVDIDNLKLLDE
ncbi:DNA primase catalytic core domain protein (plasmid) [Gloeothece citriformis PCC 7424]|uniref:DNA primase catalytic core domain protein n=1 Tax=Gloeothece citriformis (strain PCC 7424) TaxID=65393 RepID=B7KMA6_GLOC7|nr:DUF5906 domain-containing protein [Gloeothece citriformis]ACK73928.1 DNA primase catalytic core domain protein [Gloeothece citriformis PCC 7424]